MFDATYIILIVFLVFLFGGLFVFIIAWGSKRKEVFQKIESSWRSFVKGESEIYIDKFYEIRQLTLKTYTSNNASNYECEGVFAIIDNSANQFYINESKKIFNSINLQLKGRGNKELFEAIESGHEILIKAYAYRFVLEEKRQDLLNDLTKEYVKKGFSQHGRKTISVFEKINYHLSMKLFADSRVKYISLDDYIKITDSFSIQDDYNENANYYMTESFGIIAKFKTVSVNFGMDFEDRFDYFIVALRDGKTEYDAINKRIAKYEKLIEKNPNDNKSKNALRKYKKVIKDIPEYKPYSPAGSGDSFDESLIDVEYEGNKELAKDYVVLDVETNGLSKKNDDLLSISIYDPLKKVCYNRFLPLDMQPSVATSYINGINDSDLKDRLHINQAEADKIIEFFNLKNRTLLVYGPDDFDSLFVQNYFQRQGLTGFEDLRFENIKRHIPSGAFDLAGSASKDNMCKLFGIDGVEEVHSGLNDCLLEWKLFEKFIEYKPIRIGNKFYKFNKNYVVPVTVLIQNPKIYQYTDIPIRYVLGDIKRVFHYDISEKTLNKIKRFDTNITGISLENIIYASLGAIEQNNSSFLIQNKMQLEKIATIERNINEIPITIGEDGLVEAVNEKDKEFIEEVNDVALAIKNELNPTFEFIKNNVFVNEEILSQELVLSENDRVLALCDLSSKSAVMEIKTVSPSVNNIGYLDPKITYQLYYQAKKRSAYYLHIFIGGGYERLDKTQAPRYCSIDISKIELNEYTKEDYEKMLCKLTMQEEIILEFIKNNPNCQYKDLEQAFPNYSRRMLEERVKSLERKKHIIRVGNKRVYHWECLD